VGGTRCPQRVATRAAALPPDIAPSAILLPSARAGLAFSAASARLRRAKGEADPPSSQPRLERVLLNVSAELARFPQSPATNHCGRGGGVGRGRRVGRGLGVTLGVGVGVTLGEGLIVGVGVPVAVAVGVAVGVGVTGGVDVGLAVGVGVGVAGGVAVGVTLGVGVGVGAPPGTRNA
jgi:hypothetical protein